MLGGVGVYLNLGWCKVGSKEEVAEPDAIGFTVEESTFGGIEVFESDSLLDLRSASSVSPALALDEVKVLLEACAALAVGALNAGLLLSAVAASLFDRLLNTGLTMEERWLL
jgi:hypothetical protein